MSSTTKGPEGFRREDTISWETLKPEDLLPLLNVSITEQVIQHATAAIGFAELAASDNPRHSAQKKEFAETVKDKTITIERQLRAIREILRDPSKPVPVDRTTYPNTPMIILDKVILPPQTNPG